MATVIRITDHRAARQRSRASDFATSAVVPLDPIEPMGVGARRRLTRRSTARRARVVPGMLIMADLVGLSLAFVLATLWPGADRPLASTGDLARFALALPCCLLIAKLHGLYRRDRERINHGTSDDVVGIFHVVTLGSWLLLLASRLMGWNSPRVLTIATFWILAALLVLLARAGARWVCARIPSHQQNTLIVGAGEVGQLLCRKLMNHPEYGAKVVGFVDRAPKIRRLDLPEHVSILGGPELLPEIIERLQVERVVLAFTKEPPAEVLAQLRRLQPLGVQIDIVPRLFEGIGSRASLHVVDGLPLIGLPRGRVSRSARLVKRGVDLAAAAAALIVSLPLMAYIAVRIRRESRGGVLHRETRLGASMRQFEMLRFRTVLADSDAAAHHAYSGGSMTVTAEIQDDGLQAIELAPSTTRVGLWLRQTGLDGLPQLINVLKGDISFVGPRPYLPYEVERLDAHHFERFAVPQGLTGLREPARADSRDLDALDIDLAYVRDWSLGLDLRLLLRAPLQLFARRAAFT